MADNKTTTGLPKNTAAALAYLLGPLTGIIMLLAEKDKFIRFHAMQSIVVFGLLLLAYLIPIINILMLFVGLPLWIILVVFLMWKAYKGEEFTFPVIGEFAKKQVAK